MEEEELRGILTSLCIKHGIDVQVNPAHYDIKSPAAIDVEHDEEGNLVGIGVFDGKHSYYFTEVTEILDIEFQKLDFIAHNGISDLELLRQWGLLVSDKQLLWDSMLLGHIIDSSLREYGLKEMAKRELGIEYPSYDNIVGKHKVKTKKAPKCPQTEVGCCGRRTLDKWPVDIGAMYNSLDCVATWKLYEKQCAAILQ